MAHVKSARSRIARPNHRSSGITHIKVPVALLLAKDLTPAAKFLWIRLRFDATHRRPRSHHPRRLAKRTHLARSTIYEALRQAAASGWLVPSPLPDPVPGARRWKLACPVREARNFVRIPVDLIRAGGLLRPQAILCYGLLQAIPTFQGRASEFRWKELREFTGLHIRTLQRAVRALAAARWIGVAQRSPRGPVWVGLQHADEAWKEEVRKSLDQAPHVGEALMRAMLSVIADAAEFQDGARPDFLKNPASGERLELDRYYPVHRVAFEFNGRQHYEATGRFAKRDVEAQRRRDAFKKRICKERDIKLVVVHAGDLTLKGMLTKIGELLPKRALGGLKETIRFLNSRGRQYRRAAAFA